jgi:ABC-type sugar transport system ATPase subunit
MNLVEATIEGDEISFGQFRVPLASARRPPRGVDNVVLGIRPESFDDAAFAQSHLPRIDVTVEVLEELGSDSHVFFHVAAPRVTIETRNASDDETTILAEHDSRFTARVDPATRAGVGAPLELAVNPAGFHFFDVQSGESLLLADARSEAAHEEALPG